MNVSRWFHAAVHPLPSGALATRPIELDRCRLTALEMDPPPRLLPFANSFEQTSELLGRLERLFLEPDGSFVWVASDGADGPAAWQLDGMLYDRAGRLLYMELKGTCHAAALDRLLKCLGWPQLPLAFELVRKAVWLPEEDFRRYAGLTGVRPMA